MMTISMMTIHVAVVRTKPSGTQSRNFLFNVHSCCQSISSQIIFLVHLLGFDWSIYAHLTCTILPPPKTAPSFIVSDSARPIVSFSSGTSQPTPSPLTYRLLIFALSQVGSKRSKDQNQDRLDSTDPSIRTSKGGF